MTKAYVAVEEWAGYHYLRDEPTRKLKVGNWTPAPEVEVEISDEDRAEYERVEAEHDAWQRRLVAMAEAMGREAS